MSYTERRSYPAHPRLLFKNPNKNIKNDIVPSYLFAEWWKHCFLPMVMTSRITNHSCEQFYIQCKH